MLHINVANVLNILITLFQITHIPLTPINEREIQLRDVIKDVITNAVNDVSFDVHTDTTLEFQNFWEMDLLDTEFVTDEELEESNDDDDYRSDSEDSCTPEHEIVNNNYKRKVVEFWESGKKSHYSLSAVQNRFKKVKSLHQLYRWEHSLQKGGTRREKLIYISRFKSF